MVNKKLQPKPVGTLYITWIDDEKPDLFLLENCVMPFLRAFLGKILTMIEKFFKVKSILAKFDNFGVVGKLTTRSNQIWSNEVEERSKFG